MATRQKLPTPSPGISRIDQESTRTHGFVGRVGYRRTDSGWRPQFTAFFGDRSHGGANESLKAAEKWLRAIKKQIGNGSARSAGATRGAAKKAGAKKATAKKSAGRGTKTATRRASAR